MTTASISASASEQLLINLFLSLNVSMFSEVGLKLVDNFFYNKNHENQRADRNPDVLVNFGEFQNDEVGVQRKGNIRLIVENDEEKSEGQKEFKIAGRFAEPAGHPVKNQRHPQVVILSIGGCCSDETHPQE